MDVEGGLTPARGELLAAEYATIEGLDFLAASVAGGGNAAIIEGDYHALTIKALVSSLSRTGRGPADQPVPADPATWRPQRGPCTLELDAVNEYGSRCIAITSRTAAYDWGSGKEKQWRTTGAY